MGQKGSRKGLKYVWSKEGSRLCQQLCKHCVSTAGCQGLFIVLLVALDNKLKKKNGFIEDRSSDSLQRNNPHHCFGSFKRQYPSVLLGMQSSYFDVFWVVLVTGYDASHPGGSFF